ncbi:MAG: O-antigen ligase family protein, partial [Chloroflexota bacterium]|nr:O-antigen ligase family protein [Chloroflexota bacterium]
MTGRPSVTGKALILMPLAVLITAIVIASWLNGPAAIVLTALAVPVVFLAAYRWPRALLITTAVAPLADPVLLGMVIEPPLEPGIQYFAEGLLAMVGLAVVVRAWRERTLLNAIEHPLTWFLAAFLLLAAASALVNSVPIPIAVAGVVFTVDAVALFYLPRMTGFPPIAARSAAVVLICVLGAAALLAIGQAMLDPNLLGFPSFRAAFGEGSRATAFFANPNMLGAMLGLGTPLVLFAIPRQIGISRWALLTAGLVLLLALVLTFSRGAWIGTVAGFGSVALLLDRRALLIGAGLGLAAVLLVNVMPRNLLPGADELDGGPDVLDSTVDRFNAIGSGRDLRARFLLEGLPIVGDHPLLGVGPGRYGGAAANIFGTPVYAAYDTGLYGFHTVHIFWLHLLGEFGVLGSAAFVGMLLSSWLQVLRTAMRSNGLAFVLLAGIAAGAAVMSVNSGTEMLLEGN